MKKRILCFFTAFFLFFSVIFIDVPSVFAAGSFNAPDIYFDGCFTSAYIENFYNDIQAMFDYNNLDISDYYIVGATSSNISDAVQTGYKYLYIFPVSNGETGTKVLNTDANISYIYFTNSTVCKIADISDTSVLATRSMTFQATNNTYKECILQNGSSVSPGRIRMVGSGYIQDSGNNGWSYNSFFFFNYVPSFAPNTDGYTGLYFHEDPLDFYNWLIDTGKVSQFPSFLASNMIYRYIEYFMQFGGSSTSFFGFFNKWLSNFNVVAQTTSTINGLKSLTDRLYQEYLDYRSGTHRYWPSATKLDDRKNIDTLTDDNNTTLITDDVNDDIITSILRDILRGVIAVSNNIIATGQNIVAKLDQLTFTVNVVNDGGTSTSFNPTSILDKMDAIIEALGQDTVSVDIDQTTQDSTDDFFNDWNDAFSAEVADKFPVTSQLHSLFSDDFFEKCGIDYNNDGAVYSYYSSSVGLTRSGSSTENDAVSDFISNFGGADPNFLNSAAFSESVPDWTINIGGSDVSIFSFNLYAKYRGQIHFIIGFIAWTFFLLGLYKSLPSVIGGVASTADVVHSLSDDK